MRSFLILWTLLAVWILLLPAERVTPHKTMASEIALLVLVIFVHVAAHPVAYGHATDKGVRYRRYLHERFLPWSDFSEVVWSPGHFGLRLRNRKYPESRLDFIENTAWADLWCKFRGRTPEKVIWIRSRILEGH